MKYTTKSFEEEFGVSAEDVIEILSGLKKERPCKYFGICYNLSNLIIEINNDDRRMGYNVIEVFSLGWKHHTGILESPVPYESCRGLWEGNQLVLRIDLINYIIKQLEEIINE